MNTQDDSAWKALLAQSAPTFAPDATPPYGFLTSTLARLKTEKKDREILEIIGFRAFFAITRHSHRRGRLHRGDPTAIQPR